MKSFSIITDRAKYQADRQDNGVWKLQIDFNGGINAVYIFPNHADTAIAQSIFKIDKSQLF